MPRTKFKDEEERRAYYRERSAAQRAKSPERANFYCQQWRARNPEKVKQGWARYYEENKESLRARGIAYACANAEAIENKRRDRELAAPGTAAARRRARNAKHPELALWRAAKRNATVKNLAFNLDVNDIVIPDVCPVFGIELIRGIGKFADTSPSVDKIIPALGYVKGNIVIVSWKANRLKNNATIEELQKLAQFYSHFQPA